MDEKEFKSLEPKEQFYLRLLKLIDVERDTLDSNRERIKDLTASLQSRAEDLGRKLVEKEQMREHLGEERADKLEAHWFGEDRK